MYWISILFWTSLVVYQCLANFVPYIKPGENKPSCAKHQQTYCEHIEDYPNETIRYVMRKYTYVPSEFISFAFDNDVDEVRNKASGRGCSSETSLHLNTSVDCREEMRKKDEQLCRSQTRTMFPRAAKTVNDEWFFIINIDNYTQRIEFDQCVRNPNDEEDPKCKTELLRKGVVDTRSEAKCEQVYRWIRVLVLHNNGSMVYPERLIFPSCCKCSLYKL